LNALREILQSLRAKRLVIDLTPPGRGQIISHNLYEPEELQRLKERLASGGYETASAPVPTAQPSREPPRGSPHAAPSSTPVTTPGKAIGELQSLRAELAEMRRDLEALTETVRRQEREISDLRTSVGG